MVSNKILAAALGFGVLSSVGVFYMYKDISSKQSEGKTIR